LNTRKSPQPHPGRLDLNAHRRRGFWTEECVDDRIEMPKNQFLDALWIRFVRSLLAEPFKSLVNQCAEALGIHLAGVWR
jgi:hypothetical protein